MKYFSQIKLECLATGMRSVSVIQSLSHRNHRFEYCCVNQFRERVLCMYIERSCQGNERRMFPCLVFRTVTLSAVERMRRQNHKRRNICYEMSWKWNNVLELIPLNTRNERKEEFHSLTFNLNDKRDQRSKQRHSKQAWNVLKTRIQMTSLRRMLSMGRRVIYDTWTILFYSILLCVSREKKSNSKKALKE